MNQIRMFRMIALAEGISFLTLLFIVIPFETFVLDKLFREKEAVAN